MGCTSSAPFGLPCGPHWQCVSLLRHTVAFSGLSLEALAFSSSALQHLAVILRSAYGTGPHRVAIPNIEQCFLRAFLGNAVASSKLSNEVMCSGIGIWESPKVKWCAWLTGVCSCCGTQTNFPVSYPIKLAIFSNYGSNSLQWPELQ